MAPRLIAASTFDELTSMLRDACATALACDIFTLSLYDADTRTLEFLTAEERGTTRPVPEGTLAGTPSMRVIRSLASLRLDRLGDPLRAGARLIGDLVQEPESVIMSPIVHGTTPLGIVSVQAYEACRYDDDDVELLEALASCAAAAIRNVRAVARQRARDAALRDSRERLEALVSASPVAIVTMDACGQVETWNPAAEAILGIQGEVIRGQRVSEHLPDLGAVFIELQSRLDCDAPVAAVEAVRELPDGRSVELAVSCARLHTGGPATWDTLFMVVDVSEQKNAESALRQTERHFRYAQKMDAVGRLAARVSGHFAESLGTILSMAEQARAAAEQGRPPRAEITEIRAAAERAAALNRALLAFSRRQRLNVAPIVLNRMIRQMCPTLTRIAGEEVQLLTDLKADDDVIHVDPDHLECVLVNLVANARDAMPEGGRIVLRTWDAELRPDDVVRFPDRVVPGSYAALSLDDDGWGMDDFTLERIFEPFFSTRSPGEGGGLGLSIAYGLVRQNGGHIEVRSAPGDGTRFTIYLPTAKSAGGLCGTAREVSGSVGSEAYGVGQ